MAAQAALLAATEDLSVFGTDPWWLVVVKAVFCFAFLVVHGAVRDRLGAQGRRLDAAADRPQPARPLGHAAVASPTA